MKWVFLNGRVVKELEASVSLTDRGFLFGEGVFTTAKVVDGEVEYLEAHLSRLKRQQAFLELPLFSFLQKDIAELLKKNGACRGIFRLRMGSTATTSYMLLDPYIPPIAPLKVGIYPYPISHPLASLKTHAYLPRLMVKKWATSCGLDDALVCDPEGYLLEASFSNVFWMEGETIVTPKSPDLLWGVAIEEKIKKNQVRFALMKPGNITSPLFLINSLGCYLTVKDEK